MATRSRIGLVLDDGTVKSVYCHWDGYPEHHKPLLERYYDTPEKIEALLDLGDISVLGTHYNKELSQKDWTRFENKLTEEEAKEIESCTVVYNDRGEDTKARIDKDLDSFLNGCKAGEEFIYVFKKNWDGIQEWFYCEAPLLLPLSEFTK